MKKIQRITLTTTVDLRFNNPLERMNVAALADEIDSLVTRNQEIGSCKVVRTVVEASDAEYDEALCAPRDELLELLGYCAADNMP